MPDVNNGVCIVNRPATRMFLGSTVFVILIKVKNPLMFLNFESGLASFGVYFTKLSFIIHDSYKLISIP